jgi:hypothetical protein
MKQFLIPCTAKLAVFLQFFPAITWFYIYFTRRLIGKNNSSTLSVGGVILVDQTLPKKGVYLSGATSPLKKEFTCSFHILRILLKNFLKV